MLVLGSRLEDHASPILSDSAVLRLLYKCLDDEIPEILPKVDVENIRYPAVERIFEEKHGCTDILEKLTREGLLIKQPCDKVFQCPKCRSLNLRPRLLCPGCGKIDYSEGNVIIHYPCSRIGFEAEFEASPNQLTCPKCSKPLKQIGVDYGNPGHAFKCNACDDFFTFAKEEWVCKVCEHHFTPSEALAENLYSYRFNEAMKETVEKAVFFVEPMKAVLEKAGYSVECFHELPGKSGATHIFDVYAASPEHRLSEIIIDVEEKDGEPITLDETLKFLSKVFDVEGKKAKAILIAIPSLEHQAEVFAAKFRVECLTAQTLRDAVDALEKLLHHRHILPAKAM